MLMPRDSAYCSPINNAFYGLIKNKLKTPPVINIKNKIPLSKRVVELVLPIVQMTYF